MGFDALVQGNVVGAYNAYYNDINPGPFCLLVNVCGTIVALLSFQLLAVVAFGLGVGASTTQVSHRLPEARPLAPNAVPGGGVSSCVSWANLRCLAARRNGSSARRRSVWLHWQSHGRCSKAYQLLAESMQPSC
eukprot:COSAG05_NODE_2677_length_2775_cov_27.104634_1_plen_134_part_00